MTNPNTWNTEWERQQAIEQEQEDGIDGDAARLQRLAHDVRVMESDYAEASASFPERAKISPEEEADRARHQEQVRALDEQIHASRAEREALRRRVLNSETYKAEVEAAEDNDQLRRVMQRYGSPHAWDTT